MKNRNSFWILPFLICAIFPLLGQDFSKNIIGYYTSWSILARDFHISDIDAEKVNFNDLAGAMFWEFSGDKNAELLQSVYSNLSNNNRIQNTAKNGFRNKTKLIGIFANTKSHTTRIMNLV